MNMSFSMVVTMSFTGGIVIVLVLLMRLFLARAPKSSVKSRIKNIMRYKKTAAFVAVPAFVLVGTVLVALGSNPAGDGGTKKDGSQIGVILRAVTWQEICAVTICFRKMPGTGII